MNPLTPINILDVPPPSSSAMPMACKRVLRFAAATTAALGVLVFNGHNAALAQPPAPVLTHWNGIDLNASNYDTPNATIHCLNTIPDELVPNGFVYGHNRFKFTYLDGTSGADWNNFIYKYLPTGEWNAGGTDDIDPDTNDPDFNEVPLCACAALIVESLDANGEPMPDSQEYSVWSRPLCSMHLTVEVTAGIDPFKLTWNNPFALWDTLETPTVGGNYTILHYVGEPSDTASQWVEFASVPFEPFGSQHSYNFDLDAVCEPEQHNFRIQLPTEVSTENNESNIATLDLEPTNPDPPAVSFVTVTDSLAEVHWTYDDEGYDYDGFVIYQCNGSAGGDSIGAVGPGVFQFLVSPGETDDVAFPWAGPVEYRVAAIEECSEFGAAGDCMKTVHLNWYYRACEEQTGLVWNKPGVDGDVLRYDVNIKKPGTENEWQLLASIDNDNSLSATSHVHENVPVGDSLLYRIDAVGTDTSFVAMSNVVKVNFTYQDAPESPVVKYASVEVDSEGKPIVEIQFDAGDGFQGNAYELQRLNQADSSWLAIEKKSFDNDLTFSFIDADVNVDESTYRYRIQVFNECDTLVGVSQEAETILLEGFRGEGLGVHRHNLSWTKYVGFSLGIDRHEVDVKQNDNAADNGQLLATIDANRTNHDRSLDYNDNYGDSGLYCYRIKAVGSNASGTQHESKSNWVCLVEDPVVWLPTAFTPNGDELNDWYPWVAEEPNVGFIGAAPEGSTNFRLSIFNRWGNVVYDTESIGTPWDGKVNGKLVPNGVYMVKCQYIDGVGTWHVQQQSLTVLFPE